MGRWKKQRWEESERGRAEETRSEKRKERAERRQVARKGSKAAKHCGFPMVCGSGWSKSRLAKATGAEPSGQMRDEIARRCGAKRISKSKMYKAQPKSEALLESCDVEKVHAVVARSTFPNQNVQNTDMSEKCTPLWREAHFQVKMLKPPHVRTTFGRSITLHCTRLTTYYTNYITLRYTTLTTTTATTTLLYTLLR